MGSGGMIVMDETLAWSMLPSTSWISAAPNPAANASPAASVRCTCTMLLQKITDRTCDAGGSNPARAALRDCEEHQPLRTRTDAPNPVLTHAALLPPRIPETY